MALFGLHGHLHGGPGVSDCQSNLISNGPRLYLCSYYAVLIGLGVQDHKNIPILERPAPTQDLGTTEAEAGPQENNFS